ncbi:hypothetical protein ERJ75_000699100 [Trypanosoma vivax]|nr:hypothetical protein ERJ75_000699100 [Trypanosoma vivax]
MVERKESRQGRGTCGEAERTRMSMTAGKRGSTDGSRELQMEVLQYGKQGRARSSRCGHHPWAFSRNRLGRAWRKAHEMLWPGKAAQEDQVAVKRGRGEGLAPKRLKQGKTSTQDKRNGHREMRERASAETKHRWKDVRPAWQERKEVIAHTAKRPAQTGKLALDR